MILFALIKQVPELIVLLQDLATQDVCSRTVQAVDNQGRHLLFLRWVSSMRSLVGSFRDHRYKAAFSM